MGGPKGVPWGGPRGSGGGGGTGERRGTCSAVGSRILKFNSNLN